MALSLPKIKVGISTDKSHFDKTHDVNTTSDFGFCQPTLFDEVPADTDVRLQTHSKVLMGVLPQQSFARIQMQSICNYVPVKDVFLAYDYMMTQQTVQSAISEYVPTECDWVDSRQLLSFVLFGAHHVYHHEFTSWDPYRLPSILSYWRVPHGSASTAPVKIQPDSVTASNAISQVCLNINSSLSLWGSNFFDGTYWASVMNPNNNYDVPYLSVQFNNADYKFQVSHDDTYDYYVLVHLTHYGKRTMKVLYGLGYEFFWSDKKCSLNPLLAYYKTWFEKFNPQRTVQWKATDAFFLIHSFYDEPTTLQYLLAYNTSGTYQDIHQKRIETFCQFLYHLSDCCYSLPIDPFTVCTDTPSGSNEAFDYEFNVSEHLPGIASVGPDSFPVGLFSSSGQTNGLVNRILSKLLPRVNKNSVIGARVDKLMQSRFGQSLPPSNYFGDDKVDCYIDPILSNADTVSSSSVGAHLGERAGQSSTNHSSGVHKFHCNYEGFIIQLTYIVPFGGYSQGMNPHVNRVSQLDFYDRTFDGLGMEAVPVSEIFSAMKYLDETTLDSGDGTFGFRPRLMNYKFKTNMRNGDFKFASNSLQFMGYNSDRVFTEPDMQWLSGRGLIETPWTEPILDESLRYIGRSEAYGNYDRIFYDTLGVSDNFIIQMIQDYHIYSPMLPISESYDTFDNQGLKQDNNTISVGHA